MITKKIIDLVDLALADAVLTQKERDVLVAAAAKDGISEQEINIYINSQLSKRLSSRSKAELKACPSCGAQIPLLASCCPYCHHEYKDHAPARNLDCISGQEASIIRDENKKTASEHDNIGNCPNCGHPYPLISNICPACKHVLHYGDDNKKNIMALAGKIYIRINELNMLPKVKFRDIIVYRHPEYCFAAFMISVIVMQLNPNFGEYGAFPLLDLMLLMMAFMFMSPAFVFPFSRSKAARLGFMYPMMRGESPIGIRDKAESRFLADFESLENQIDTIYGDDPEAKALLDSLRNQISEAKKKNKRSRAGIVFKNLVIMGIMALLTVTALMGNDPRIDNLAGLKLNDESVAAMDNVKMLAAPDDQEVMDMQLGDFAQYGAIGQPAGIYAILAPDGKVKYRVDGVRIASTGKRLDSGFDASVHGFALMLLSGSFKTMGDKLYLFCNSDDEVFQMMKSGRGEIYASFVSKSFPRDVMQDMDDAIAQSQYYSIIDFNKKQD